MALIGPPDHGAETAPGRRPFVSGPPRMTAGDMARRTAHIDIDNVGAGRFGNPCTLGHPMRLTTRELNHMCADTGCLAA